MSKSIQALRERKNELARQANELLANNGDRTWPKEDQAKYDAIMDEMERTSGQISAHQRLLDNEAEVHFNQHPPGKKTGTGDEIDALMAIALYMRHGNNVSAEQAVAIRNAMSTTTPAEGGYTVPSEVAAMVVDALKAFGGMRDVAEIITTESGSSLSFPTSDGTAEVGEIVAENATATLGEMTFGTVALNVFMYSSKQIALPLQLIQDSAIDVVQFVINRLTDRLGRITNTHYTVGTGSGQPAGLITQSTLGKGGLTGQTTTVIYDDLVDLVHSVNRAYRGRGKFTMADSSVKVVRKIKDTAGRPIFTPSYDGGITAGAPDTLLGYPLTINDDVPAMAANAKPIAFGDLSQYKIRDVAGSFSVRRFDDSAFGLKGQAGFCGWMRSGGNLVNPAAVKHYQNGAT